jgi:hypothetical protein
MSHSLPLPHANGRAARYGRRDAEHDAFVLVSDLRTAGSGVTRQAGMPPFLCLSGAGLVRVRFTGARDRPCRPIL